MMVFKKKALNTFFGLLLISSAPAMADAKALFKWVRKAMGPAAFLWLCGDKFGPRIRQEFSAVKRVAVQEGKKELAALTGASSNESSSVVEGPRLSSASQ